MTASGSIAITGGHVVPIEGDPIENGTVESYRDAFELLLGFAEQHRVETRSDTIKMADGVGPLPAI